MKVSRRDNLDRYYLFQGFGIGIFLHKIHHDEDPNLFHSHPWNGLSIILGSYIEERLGQAERRRTLFNFIKGTTFHRVRLVHPNKKPVWTLFIHGRKYNKWQVKSRDGKILDTEPWDGLGGRTSYKP